MAGGLRAEELVLYCASSLREAIGQIAAEFGASHGLKVKTQFGPSGRMRERIERGEHANLFTSADVGHARKLVRDGRASRTAVFVRNTACVLSQPSFGAVSDPLMDMLPTPGERISV